MLLLALKLHNRFPSGDSFLAHPREERAPSTRHSPACAGVPRSRQPRSQRTPPARHPCFLAARRLRSPPLLAEPRTDYERPENRRDGPSRSFGRPTGSEPIMNSRRRKRALEGTTPTATGVSMATPRPRADGRLLHGHSAFGLPRASSAVAPRVGPVERPGVCQRNAGKVEQQPSVRVEIHPRTRSMPVWPLLSPPALCRDGGIDVHTREIHRSPLEVAFHTA